VALSVVRDAAAGFDLAAQDFKDAECALKSIQSYCNLLQEVSLSENTSLDADAIVLAWQQIRSSATLPSLRSGVDGYKLVWRETIAESQLNAATGSPDKYLVSAISSALSYFLDCALRTADSSTISIDSSFSLTKKSDNRTHFSFRFSCDAATLGPEPQCALNHYLEDAESNSINLLPLLCVSLKHGAELLILTKETEFLEMTIVL
jgi:hypothetical protein